MWKYRELLGKRRVMRSIVPAIGFCLLNLAAGHAQAQDASEAVDAVRTVESRYERHARVARDIAAEYFDSSRILTNLLDEVASANA